MITTMDSSISIQLLSERYPILLLFISMYVYLYCIHRTYPYSKLLPMLCLIWLIIINISIHYSIDKIFYLIAFISAITGDYYLTNLDPNDRNSKSNFVKSTICFRLMFISFLIILSNKDYICNTVIFVLFILLCITANKTQDAVTTARAVKEYILTIVIFGVFNIIDIFYSNIFNYFYLGSLFIIISDSMFGLFYLKMKIINSYTRSAVILTYWTAMIFYFMSVPN